MISKKTIYGLQAAILLAKSYHCGPVLISDLAHEGQIPKKFLESILLELRKKSILKSKKGKGGGYILGKDPHDISVGDIIRILEGSFAEIYFEGESRETGEIKLILKDLRDALSSILNKTSLSDVIERASNSQNVLNFVI